MMPGEHVRVRVDAYDIDLDGIVDSVPPATGAVFEPIAPDNATGNFTKIVPRLPVKIVFAPNQPKVGLLRLGMSVETTVHTHFADVVGKLRDTYPARAPQSGPRGLSRILAPAREHEHDDAPHAGTRAASPARLASCSPAVLSGRSSSDPRRPRLPYGKPRLATARAKSRTTTSTQRGGRALAIRLSTASSSSSYTRTSTSRARANA